MPKRKGINTPSLSDAVTNNVPEQPIPKDVGLWQQNIHDEILTMVDFTKPAAEVAQQMIGKKIKRVLSDGKTVEATITNVIPYTELENDKGKYKEILNGQPGELIVTSLMGHLIMNIVTGEMSCVTLESIQIDGKTIKGKGNVSKALEIKGIGTGTKVTGVNVTHPDSELVIE